MRQSFVLFLLVVLWITFVPASFSQSSGSAYDAVDTFIGTGADGNTFPGATIPFGMIQWSPDTRPDGWYHFGDKTIRGFSLTHISGAGCPIYGDVPILPMSIDLLNSSPGTGSGGSHGQFQSVNDTAMPFSHDGEKSQPGYYSITDINSQIRTELTVTDRAGIARFHFPEGMSRSLIFKVSGSATMGAKNREKDFGSYEIRGHDTVLGSVHSGGFCGSPTHYVLYFVAKFQKPFDGFGSWTDQVTLGATSGSAHLMSAYVGFLPSTEPVVMKVGISFVSIANAEENLAKEIPGWDFEAVHAAAKVAWTKALDKVQADGGTPEQRTIFYTGVYHSMLSPNVFSDENGDYIGFDQKVRRLPPGKKQFANFSDWDIYRNTIQFQALLFPEQTSQMMQSLVRDAEQSGWLPRWAIANDNSYIMGGDSSAILLSEAYAFGARDFDLKSALHFMLKGATDPGKGLHNYPERPGLADYISRGYVPVSGNEEIRGVVHHGVCEC